jgi:hypothetical protein
MTGCRRPRMMRTTATGSLRRGRQSRPPGVLVVRHGPLSSRRGCACRGDGAAAAAPAWVWRCDLHGGSQSSAASSSPCGDPQLVVVDAAAALSGQVEVGVVGQVHHRRRVGDGAVVHPQPVPLIQRIGDFGIQRAGKPISPARLRYRSTTPTRSVCSNGVAAQMRLWKPCGPPGSWCAPVRASVYVVPSRVNLPPAIRSA